MERNNQWLKERLNWLHQKYFIDVKIANTILVRFGRITKTRLGSITTKKLKRFSQPVTVISLNKLLKLEEVPLYVIDTVLAHEFTHYCHGFHSPLPKLYRYPHQAGVVDQELKKRGLSEALQQERKWTKTKFLKIYQQHLQ